MIKLAKWNTRLRKAREAMKLSLAEATRLLYEEHKIKMHRSNLGMVERGESDIIVNRFKALCDIYAVSADWILDLKEHKI